MLKRIIVPVQEAIRKYGNVSDKDREAARRHVKQRMIVFGHKVKLIGKVTFGTAPTVPDVPLIKLKSGEVVYRIGHCTTCGEAIYAFDKTKTKELCRKHDTEPNGQWETRE